MPVAYQIIPLYFDSKLSKSIDIAFIAISGSVVISTVILAGIGQLVQPLGSAVISASIFDKHCRGGAQRTLAMLTQVLAMWLPRKVRIPKRERITSEQFYLVSLLYE